MDSKIKKVFEENLNIDFVDGIISNSSQRDIFSKIKVRPILLRDKLYFQVSEYRGTQIYHKNYEKQELLKALEEWFNTGENPEGRILFKQVELKTRKRQIHILISKKGKVTVKEKSSSEPLKPGNLSHNRTKRYILQEGMDVPFLKDLGVMTQDGKIVSSKYDKFKQINRFLEFAENILENLPKDKELTIIDFGCGKSYLTFALYYYLVILKHYRVSMTGLDLKEDVIKACSQLAQKYQYDKLHFLQGDIASFEGASQVDMVVTLHACDTATDFALYKAVKWGAKVILSVPCCQHEWNGQMQNEALEPVLKYGLIKERMAALMTDAVRADLLEVCGYRVQILEFIDLEHTPKNILIRGVKSEKGTLGDIKEVEKLLGSFNVKPALYRLLKEEREQ